MQVLPRWKIYAVWLIAILPIKRISASSFRTSWTSSLCSSFWTLSRQQVARRCRVSAAVTSGSATIRLCSEQVRVDRSSRDGRRDRTHIRQKYSCCKSSSSSTSADSGAAGSVYFTHSATVAEFRPNFTTHVHYNNHHQDHLHLISISQMNIPYAVPLRVLPPLVWEENFWRYVTQIFTCWSKVQRVLAMVSTIAREETSSSA